jgi:hypothetical protein
MLNNQTNNHHVQKDNFKFIKDGDHEAQYHYSSRGQ